MSYIINKYNGDQVAVVADGTIDTTLDLKLIGKNYAGYGEAQNENLVWLLENFANVSAPPKPMKGQVWFDSGTNKLKFFDNAKWRTTGGAEIGPSAPTGLTVGDFWFDTLNNQLNAWNGSEYVLVGPQAAGTETTEMRSRNVQATVATGGASHPIIEAIINGEVVFIISHDAMFELDAAVNAISGFTKIQKGVTLRNTNDDGLPGQTVTDYRFWGTATNSDRLGGYLASDFTLSNSADFSTVVSFSDAGYTVGSLPYKRLRVFNDGQTIPTIYNQLNDTIRFKTTTGGSVTHTPLELVGANILPGANLTSNIGSSLLQFSAVYASTFNGTATQANTLNVAGTFRTASIPTAASTIAVRTSVDEVISGVNVTAGSLKANYFVGIATTAFYADLAEKYLADADYEVGTVMMVGGEFEVTAAVEDSRPLGVISENPAFMMNSDLIGGTYVALKGRVPVKVVGSVCKGDRLVAASNGVATAVAVNHVGVFAIALESSDDESIKIIEAVIL
jgi:hypothetical protein